MNELNFEHWDGFDRLMLSLGFEMDCYKSFEEYCKTCSIKVKTPASERESKRNALYLLEQADKNIVGSYALSHYRYLTHWSMGYSKYEPEYLNRVLKILEKKIKEEN